MCLLCFFVAGFKSEWARHTWECVAPIHIRGYCPHPSNHLRRRIHQPSLLPHNIHRNGCAVQEGFWLKICSLKFTSRNVKKAFQAVDLACCSRPLICRIFSNSRVEISQTDKSTRRSPV